MPRSDPTSDDLFADWHAVDHVAVFAAIYVSAALAFGVNFLSSRANPPAMADGADFAAPRVAYILLATIIPYNTVVGRGSAEVMK